MSAIQFTGGQIARLTVTQAHSLSGDFLEALLKILASQTEPNTRVLIFTASHPEALLADVAALLPFTPKQALHFSELGQKVCNAIEALPFPVVAAVDGIALGGGCELVLACDLVYASDQAQFGQIEVHGGIIPGFGGTWRLPRRVGDLKARELLYTGAILSAVEAQKVGLVNEVVPRTDLLDRVETVARAIAANAPLGVGGVKALLLANRDLSLEQSNKMERQRFASLFGTHDQKEGMAAFLEKRAAQFRGE